MARSTSSSVKMRAVDDENTEASAESEAPITMEAPAARPQVAEAPAANKPRKKGFARRIVLPTIVLAALAGGAWYGQAWWTDGRFMVSTDDAYVEGDIANIAPKVTGYVSKVNVVANQHVKAGDVLVTLDNGDYSIAAEQAEASIATQKLALVRFDAQIEASKAALAQSRAQKTALEATLRGAQITAARTTELAAKSAGTIADRDNAEVALDQAKANLIGADSAIASANANIAVVSAQRAEAESEIRSLELTKAKAERDLSFTVLKAPFDGVIGNLAVQTGDLVSPGQRLAALVPVDQLYIEANFKETQVAWIKPGAEVSIHVDAIEDHVIKGRVESIAPASGSVFSLLPPENATGNFTKVIQRLPVRIALPKSAFEDGHLRAGLSVIVDIDSRTGHSAGAKVAAAQ
ncbi:HlyD family secretion protein [Rhizobium sp. KVB221]|uniref:HlyD family secretion protein n=1 Tax=Rhizobium setariae TaxID=2801340 RepID=A0A937CPD9_9HYPH|nr:HlyD family secretion protein [Rhizobium setariae]MBL0371692.1 HlyD family secretion protein [Rhizobium setariae]